MIIRFAVWIPITLEEISRPQLLVAVVASEMLRMPCLAQSCDYLADNWLVACVAAALLHCVYTLSWHVGLKVSKHKLKLIASLSAFVERWFYYGFFARLIMSDPLCRLHVIGDWLLLMLLLLGWVDLIRVKMINLSVHLKVIPMFSKHMLAYRQANFVTNRVGFFFSKKMFVSESPTIKNIQFYF